MNTNDFSSNNPLTQTQTSPPKLFNEHTLAQICVVTTISLYLSGISVMSNIVKKGSSSGISILPFLTCAVSCTIWLKFALITEDPVLWKTNLAGTLLEWIYVFIYISYLPTEISKNHNIRRWLTIQIIFMFTILITASQPKYTDEDLSNLKDFLIKVCIFTNICNYMSPLGQALYCYKQKSTENLSVVLNFTYWIQVCAWLTYGLTTGKIVVIIPNSLGIFLTSFTMSLFLMFPRGKQQHHLGGGQYSYNLSDRPHII